MISSFIHFFSWNAKGDIWKINNAALFNTAKLYSEQLLTKKKVLCPKFLFANDKRKSFFKVGVTEA